MTGWPSGLRRWLQAPVRKGVGSNPTAVILICFASDLASYMALREHAQGECGARTQMRHKFTEGGL